MPIDAQAEGIKPGLTTEPQPVNAQMLEGLRVGLECAELVLAERKIALAGYPDKWRRQAKDVETISAAITAAEAAQAQPAAVPATADKVAEAIRRQFVKLPRFSFHLDSRGNVRRVEEASGNWIEFEQAHELFDPVQVDKALGSAA
jgi:hypothetical protein